MPVNQLANKPQTGLDARHEPRRPAAACDPGHLARLNPAQRAAVLHGDGAVAGPLLVIAGAGTGKTNTLVHRARASGRSPAPTRAASCS